MAKKGGKEVLVVASKVRSYIKSKKCMTSSDAIDAKAKELGLWGIGQIGRLGYSGNSIIVRVPKKIAEFLKFKEGKNVFIRPEGRNRLVVEPQ